MTIKERVKNSFLLYIMNHKLLLFIKNIQLSMKNDVSRSDQILRTLCLFGEQKIGRKTCVQIIFNLLKFKYNLLKEFSEIVEITPSNFSSISLLLNDPYINTVLTFQDYPGCLKNFLADISNVLTKKYSLIDAFCRLETYKKSCAPFWLLWDLYAEVTPMCLFFQLLYDGSVDIDKIPKHIRPSIRPSGEDSDPVSCTYKTIFDSEILARYEHETRNDEYPGGLRVVGSYGLLRREEVETVCSGRTIEDQKLLNDRWSLSASGKVVQFLAIVKNQYEERIFLFEDERVEMDVTLSQLRNTGKRLNNILSYINDPTNEELKSLLFIDDNFPISALTSIDYHILGKLYGEESDLIYERIRENPSEIIPLIQKRIQEKSSMLREYIRNKEKEYYNVNKKVTKKSLDSFADDENYNPDHFINIIRGGRVGEIQQEKKNLKMISNILTKVAKNSNKTSVYHSVTAILSYFLVIFKVEESPGLSRNLHYQAIPTITEFDNFQTPEFYMSVEMFKLFGIFLSFNQFINCALSHEQQSIKENLHSKGVLMAMKLGHVSQSSLSDQLSEEEIAECISQFYNDSKNPSLLETLFDSPESPIKNSSDLRKALNYLFKNAPQCTQNDPFKSISEACSLDDPLIYKSLCLKVLSGTIYVRGTITLEESIFILKVHCELPRALNRKKNVYIKNVKNQGYVYCTDDNIAIKQSKILSPKKEKAQVRNSTQNISSTINFGLKFRLGLNGVEFENCGDDLICLGQNL